jgi:hypothetical protein
MFNLVNIPTVPSDLIRFGFKDTPVAGSASEAFLQRVEVADDAIRIVGSRNIL